MFSHRSYSRSPRSHIAICAILILSSCMPNKEGRDSKEMLVITNKCGWLICDLNNLTCLRHTVGTKAFPHDLLCSWLFDQHAFPVYTHFIPLGVTLSYKKGLCVTGWRLHISKHYPLQHQVSIKGHPFMWSFVWEDTPFMGPCLTKHTLCGTTW